MSEHKIPIPSMLYNAAVGGHVTNSQQIIDEVLNKEQSVLNAEQQKLNKGILEEKEYTSGSDNGMGRVVLRKNIVNGVNILTQNMINKTNTIYIIQYDFTLGEDITVFDNCVLEFDGGSISGQHTITGVNTGINARLIKIFNTNVILAGTWNVSEAYPEWFGAKGDGITDDTIYIQKTFDTFNVIKLSRKEYKVETVTDGIILNLPIGKHLIGVDINHKAENTIYTLHCENTAARAILQINSGCIVENITIKGVSNSNTFSDTNDIIQNGVCCIKTNGECSRITLTEIQCLGGNIGFFIMAYLTNIEHCYSYYNLIGFSITGKLDNDGTLQVENTTINMRTCYCILSHRHAFYIKGLVYSNFENLAADGCGHELIAINSWSDIYAPYYFESLKACNFLSIGAESSLKMIKTNNCINIAIRNLNFNYGFHVDAQKSGSYTPGHLFEFNYSKFRLEDPWIKVGGCDPSAINTMLNNNSSAPLIYLEDTAKTDIRHRFYGIQNSGILSKNNISIGGFINSDNIVVEDDTIYKNSYDITSGNIANALNSIDFKNNPYSIITINFSGSNPEFGTYSNKQYDFYGKTVIFKNTSSTSPNIITCYGQGGTFTIKNGTFIFEGFSISDSSLKNRTEIFVANNATIKFIAITFLQFNIESINYIVKADIYSYIEAINCTFTVNFKKLSSSNNYKCYFASLPIFKNKYVFEGSIIANTYIAHGNGTPNLELINKVVDSLPTIFSSDYVPKTTMKGMQAYFNNKLCICDGTQWKDATGNTV